MGVGQKHQKEFEARWKEALLTDLSLGTCALRPWKRPPHSQGLSEHTLWAGYLGQAGETDRKNQARRQVHPGPVERPRGPPSPSTLVMDSGSPA